MIIYDKNYTDGTYLGVHMGNNSTWNKNEEEEKEKETNTSVGLRFEFFCKQTNQRWRGDFI